jgi:hypothetical protein
MSLTRRAARFFSRESMPNSKHGLSEQSAAEMVRAPISLPHSIGADQGPAAVVHSCPLREETNTAQAFRFGMELAEFRLQPGSGIKLNWDKVVTVHRHGIWQSFPAGSRTTR